MFLHWKVDCLPPVFIELIKKEQKRLPGTRENIVYKVRIIELQAKREREGVNKGENEKERKITVTFL